MDRCKKIYAVYYEEFCALCNISSLEFQPNLLRLNALNLTVPEKKKKKTVWLALIPISYVVVLKLNAFIASSSSLEGPENL